MSWTGIGPRPSDCQTLFTFDQLLRNLQINIPCLMNRNEFKPISGRVDRASATEAVDTGSIPGRVKPKTIKIGIHSFPA